MSKILPFSKDIIEELTKKYPTPFYIYDEQAIAETARKFKDKFSDFSGYKNYFAVKALPNPKICKLLAKQGMGLDCSSMAELVMAEKIGVSGEDIMFSSNDTAKEEYVKAKELGAIINLDDISHVNFLEESAGLPELLCFRFNPGNIIEGNEIIGNPENAKFGMPKEDILESIKICQAKGVKRFGLHTMTLSNDTDYKNLVKIVENLFELAEKVKQETKVEFEFINLGGGIGIPYHPEDDEFDLESFMSELKKLYDEKLSYQPRIITEYGRAITGPHGYLISRVIHLKNTYKQYIGLDASMQNLMRPAMYGAYHHITILGKEDLDQTENYDVTGSLCENNDKFAIDRKLPKVEVGDLLVINDVGAHAHAMGFNYNGKLRSAEFLMNSQKEFELIRRAETLDDYFATLDF